MIGGRAILVLDLEGVPGVCSAAALLDGDPAHPAALAAAARAAEVALEALEAAGWAVVEVHDTHASGGGAGLAPDAPGHAPVVRADGARLREALAGADAALFLGMHAPAGRPGFAAHTHDLLSRWSVDGRPLSELELMLAVCAEAGTRALAVVGEGSLRDHLEAVGLGEVPFVVANQAEGPLVATTRSLSEMQVELRSALSAARPHLSPPRPVALTLSWPRRWPLARLVARAAEGDGELAEGRAIARPVEAGLRVEAATWADAWAMAEGLVDEVALDASRGLGVSGSELEDIEVWLRAAREAAPKPPSRPSQEELRVVSTRLQGAFLELTADGDEASRALRALVLTMLEGHAPRAFAAAGLAATGRAALEALDSVPATLDPELDPDLAIARVDAAWLRGRAGRAGPRLRAAEVDAFLQARIDRDDLLNAFVVSETAHLAGVPDLLRLRGRPLRGDDLVGDLYWLTHQVLFATRFLTTDASPHPLGPHIEALCLAAPRLAAAGSADLLAEVAICLQAVGEGPSADRCLPGLLARIDGNGRASDRPEPSPWTHPEPAEIADHTTGAVWVASMGAWEAATRDASL